jgi:hypothetical protein
MRPVLAQNYRRLPQLIELPFDFLINHTPYQAVLSAATPNVARMLVLLLANIH